MLTNSAHCSNFAAHIQFSIQFDSRMILPIVAYGHPVLRKVAKEIDEHYPQLDKLIEDMWETMYASNGVGLAAPQINKEIRLFVIDSAQIFNNMDEKEKE